MKHLEIEQKYNAASITPEQFKTFCEKKSKVPLIIVSGYDHFYAHPKDKNCFFRHRVGADGAQLTFKRKAPKGDNVVRIEHNLDLKYTTKNGIKGFCRQMGFRYNTSIFKTALVYNYPMFAIAYYIVYSADLVEMGRFIEIELDEFRDWGTEEAARKVLLSIEKECRNMGISSMCRIKESLFELYRK